MATIGIVELESAINHCRNRHAGSEGRLSPDLAELASIYGMMIFERKREIDLDELTSTARGLLTVSHDVIRPLCGELMEFKELAAHMVSLDLRSKSAVIRRLAPAILKLVELGYSQTKILDTLEKAGLPPTPKSTLKSVLTRLKKAQKLKLPASDGSTIAR